MGSRHRHFDRNGVLAGIVGAGVVTEQIGAAELDSETADGVFELRLLMKMELRPAGCGEAKKVFPALECNNPAAGKSGAENALRIFPPFAGMIRIRFNGYNLSPLS